MFGSEGSKRGQFTYPHGVAIDSQGFIYIADCFNHRVQKFTPGGQFISSFGTKRSVPGQLSHPSGITVDDNGLLYINNDNSEYVSVYTTSGQYIHQFNKNYKNNHASFAYFHGITTELYLYAVNY